MTLSVPSRFAAVISALRPPPAAADVATAQLAGLAGVEAAGGGDDEPLGGGDLLSAAVRACDDEHAAISNASAVAPAQTYPRGTSLTMSTSRASGTCVRANDSQVRGDSVAIPASAAAISKRSS